MNDRNLPGSCGHCVYYSSVLDVCYLPKGEECKGELKILSPVECPKCMYFDSCTVSCTINCVCPFVKSKRFSSIVYRQNVFQRPSQENVTFGGVDYD